VVHALPVDDADVLAFLRTRFAPSNVERLERLGGGAWSASYGFEVDGRRLIARFGRWREDYEADRRAMALAGPDLPVPRVLEIGDAFDGAYALSERHEGVFLESLDEPAWRRVLPAVLRALDAMRAADGVALLGPPPMPWRAFLLASLEDVPGERVSGWRARLAADPDLDAQFRLGEERLRAALPDLPERTDVLHVDLLHGNVLAAPDGRELVAVFDWGCTMLGDFVYELAWFSFWAPWHPGLAAVDLVGAARTHLEAQGVDLDGFERRLAAYEVHIGLTHLAWHAFADEPAELRAVSARLAPLLLPA
jgi:aminoglycoside phosphotransferase (APT) family kinase protein